MKRKQSKVLSILLSLAMLCSMVVPTAFAADSRYIDTTDHWAETAIERWSDYGIIEGYGDAFNPDYSITRGQMATILSKTLGLTEEAENPFSDISADEWYAPYVLRCYKAGIMLGDNGKANPDAEITRQEAMTMFCRAFGIKADESADLTSFKDSREIADWALPYVSALIDGGIVSGVSSDMIAPDESMSRAALVTILDRAVVQYINTSGEYDLTNKDGIILVTTGDTTLKGETKADILISQATDGKAVTFKDATVTGEVTVQADTKIISNNSKLPQIDATVEVVKKETPKKPSGGSSGGSSRPTISNLTISEEKAVTSGTYNNVTITDAVADGEVTLSNITIKGDLTINGGGSSSIKLDNCTIQGKVIMAKETGEAPRLELTNTPVATVEVQKPAIIEAVDSASAVTKIEATANIEIKGENTKIDTLAVPETAESAVAVAVTAGNISTVEAKAEISVTGASNSVNTIVATATVTADSEAVQKVEIPETATESVSVTVTGDASVDVEINSTSGAAVTGINVTVSTTLETVPDNITVGGEAVTHIHKWGEPVTTPATCEQDGEKVYTCIAEGCDDTAKTKTEVIHSLGHKYGDWKKSDDDLHVRECANDKDHYEKQEHTWDEGKITTEANCGQDGVKTYTCSVCKGTKTETINKPDHNWGDWVKVDITSHKRVCKSNATHIETADHTPIIDSAVDATCTETGKTEGSHCDVCKSVIVEQTTTPALNHDFTGEYEKDADGHWHICERDNCEETDTKAGHTYNTTNCAEVATCTVCKYEKPAGEHTWSDWEKVDDTNHKRTCSCTATETAEHSWDNGVITTEPTPTNAGVKTYTCSVCKGTKTESVPYVPKKEINFSKSGNSIRVEWSGYTASKYIFRLFDEEGNKVAESAETSSTNYSDISIYMPTPDTGVNKYKFVLYATTANSIKELDSVEDAITITVGTDAVDYEIAYNNVAENEHSITWKNGTVPSGINYIGIWKNANGTHNEKISGAISQYGIVHRKYGYQNLTFDLRVISSFDVLDGKVALTMTPPSENKYTEPSDVQITLVQNGTSINASWTGANCDNGYTWALVEDGDIHQLDFVGKNVSASTDFKPCLTRIDSGIHSYDFVLYEYDESAEDCIGKELGRLENAIEVTITGEVVDYTMSFTAPTDGQYQITLNAVPTEGNTYLTRWNRGKSNYSSIYVSDGTQTYTETTFMGALQDGDIYDLRLLTTYTLEGQTIKAVMTPPSTKTYTTVSENNIWFSESEYGYPLVEWTPFELADDEMYVCNDMEWFENSGYLYFELLNIEESGYIPITISKGTWDNKTPLYTENEAVHATITDTEQNLSLVEESDGRYKITSHLNNFDAGCFVYQVRSKGGSPLYTGFTTGKITVSPCDNIEVVVRQVKWNISADKKQVEYTITPLYGITTYTDTHTQTEDTHVSTYDELKAALNKGGVVKLNADIQTTSMLTLNTGDPAVLDLNGHTLDIPRIETRNGKSLTINQTTSGSSLINSNGTQEVTAYYGDLTLNGGTYEKIGSQWANNITLNDIVGSNNDYSFYYGKNVSITDCTFGSDTSGSGILIWGAEKSTIVNSVVYGDKRGISFSDVNKAEVENTIITAPNNAISCQTNTNLELKNVKATAASETIRVHSGCNVIIDGGEYEVTTSYSNLMYMIDGPTVTIKGGEFTGGKNLANPSSANVGTLNISGGDFTYYTSNILGKAMTCNISGGCFRYDVSEYVEDSCLCINNNDGTYSVSTKTE